MIQTKVAVVSGGNRGIGLQVALRLAGDGFTVALGSRSLLAGQQAKHHAGPAAADRIFPMQLDVADEASVNAFAATCEEQFGRVDVLINNAAVNLDHGRHVICGDLTDLQRTIDVNVIGVWRLTSALAPLLRRAKSGRIVNLSSSMAQLGTLEADSPAYRASKVAVNALTIILAKELAPDGVLVNAVDPGWVRTDMGGIDAPVSVQDGADTACWLADLPDDGPTGGFFRDRKPIPW